MQASGLDAKKGNGHSIPLSVVTVCQGLYPIMKKGSLPFPVLFRSLCSWNDRDVGPTLETLTKLHIAFYSGEYGVVTTQAYTLTRVPLCAALTDDDIARNDSFATELLHAKAFALCVATVTRRAACLFMSHFSAPLSDRTSDFSR